MLQNLGSKSLADLFAYVVSILERLSIPYMVVGGFAAITYGEPRLTLDVDTNWCAWLNWGLTLIAHISTRRRLTKR